MTPDEAIEIVNNKAQGLAPKVWQECELPEVLVAEIERLRAIVEKLPKTADGVPIVPGMELHPSPCPYPILEAHAEIKAYWITSDGQSLVDDPRKFYSTALAADAGSEVKK